MNEKEIQEVLDELHTVRPEVLNEKGKRLFKAIMKIADERNFYKNIIKEVREYIETKEKDDNNWVDYELLIEPIKIEEILNKEL